MRARPSRPPAPPAVETADLEFILDGRPVVTTAGIIGDEQ